MQGRAIRNIKMEISQKLCLHDGYPMIKYNNYYQCTNPNCDYVEHV